MTNRISMQDIIELLASKNNIPEQEAEKFVLELFNIIEEGLTSDELVKIKDFGTFKLIEIQERESIDVNTQKKILIPTHRRISFIPAQVLKSLVNKPFAHFETTPLNDGTILENVKHDVTIGNIDIEDEETIEELDNTLDNDSIYRALLAATDNINKKLTAEDENNDISFNEAENEEGNKKKSDANSNDSLDNKADEEIDEQIDVPKDVVGTSTNAPNIKSRERESKPKRSFLPWYIVIVLLIFFALFFVCNFYNKDDTPAKQEVEESSVPKSIIEAFPVIKDTLQEEVIKAAVPLETVNMDVGKTLRLIALDKYGSREFWVYIYLKNKDKIKNPDVIPVGLELVLPDMTEYDINADNPKSIANAKKRGDEEMKKLW